MYKFREPRIASPSALNRTRSACDKMFTSLLPPTRGQRLSISARALTPTVLPEWQHLHRAAIAQGCETGMRMQSDVQCCTPLNLAPLYIKCSLQHSPSLLNCHASSKLFFATRRLLSQAMRSDAEDRLFNRASIGAVRVDNSTLSRLRECAVYEVCVSDIDRAFLALLASERFRSLRAALLARVSTVGQPLGALSSNALIASDVDAIELHLRPLACNTTVVLAFCFKCYSQRAARDLSNMLLLHYEEHHFAGLHAAQYWRTADITFAAFSVRVPFFPPTSGSTLPHIRTALSTTLPQPGLKLSLTPCSQGQFSGSAPSSSSHQASPAPFGHPSRLTDAANAAASHEQSQQAALVLFPGSPAALNASLQPLGVFTAAVELVIRSRRRSGPAAVPFPAPYS